jgi:hypothetical protein
MQIIFHYPNGSKRVIRTLFKFKLDDNNLKPLSDKKLKEKVESLMHDFGASDYRY